MLDWLFGGSGGTDISNQAPTGQPYIGGDPTTTQPAGESPSGTGTTGQPDYTKLAAALKDLSSGLKSASDASGYRQANAATGTAASGIGSPSAAGISNLFNALQNRQNAYMQAAMLGRGGGSQNRTSGLLGY